MKLRPAFILASSLCFVLTVVPAAFSQNIPAGSQPEAQSSRQRRAFEEEKKRLQRSAPRPGQIESPEEQPSVRPAPSAAAFVLKAVKISGATLFGPERFRPAYKDYLGSSVTFADLERIAAAVKTLYKQQGYLSVDAYLPEQDILDGQVEIRVVEARVGEVRVEGNRWFSAALLKRFIHAPPGGLVNFLLLQKDLLRLNRNPDLEASAVIVPGSRPQTTDIVLKVKERLPYHAGIGVDNLGTLTVGKYRTSASLRSSNLSGLNDAFYYNELLTADSRGRFISYTCPVNSYGTSAGLDVTLYRMLLGREYRDQQIRGSTHIYTPHLTAELFLSERLQAYADIGMDIKSVKKWTAGLTTTNDQLRIPFAALDLTMLDRLLGGGQTSLAPRISFSVEHFLGASSREHPSASRSGTGGFFARYEQSLDRIQRGPWESYVLLRSLVQLASRTLPSSEQLQIGGYRTVRGYPEGEYLADQGGVISAEWIFPSYFIPKSFVLAQADQPLRSQLQPVVFLDLGGGKLKRVNSGEDANRFLMGAGAGLRYQFNRNFYLRLDWAKHLTEAPTQGQGPSNFYLTSQLEF